MAGGNLFGRALSYVVNELLVEGLANSFGKVKQKPQWFLSLSGAEFLLMPLDVEELYFTSSSRAFQRFAVKTNRTLENLSSKAKEVREELAEQLKEARGHDDHFRR